MKTAPAPQTFKAEIEQTKADNQALYEERVRSIKADRRYEPDAIEASLQHEAEELARANDALDDAVEVYDAIPQLTSDPDLEALFQGQLYPSAGRGYDYSDIAALQCPIMLTDFVLDDEACEFDEATVRGLADKVFAVEV